MVTSDLNFKDVTLLILAGGFGTRVRHLLGSLPKPLASIHGRPFLHWVLKNFQQIGFTRSILLTHFESEQFARFAAEENTNFFKVACLREEVPLGTAGSVLNAIKRIPHLSNYLLIANGDSIVMSSLNALFRTIKAGSTGAILGIRVEDSSRYGTLDFDEKSGRLNAFLEKNKGSGFINAGIYLLQKSSILKYDTKERPFSLEMDLFPTMLDAGEDLQVVTSDDEFIDIGTELTLPLAEDFVFRNLLRKQKI